MNLNELDFNDAGNWPTPFKGVAALLIVILLVGAGYWFHIQHKIEEYEQVAAKEQELKDRYVSRARMAANLELYREQLAEIEERFGSMLGQLPSRSEVAELLIDITQTGIASGLEFELFRPGQEQRHEFYAELPIQVRVSGSYHELGDFIGGVGALPRIVTMHDVSLQRGSERAVVMEVTAKTYRYLEDDELTR